jgi:hypothetical protein
MNHDFRPILLQEADVQPPATMLPIGNVFKRWKLGEHGGTPSTGKAKRGPGTTLLLVW